MGSSDWALSAPHFAGAMCKAYDSHQIIIDGLAKGSDFANETIDVPRMVAAVCGRQKSLIASHLSSSTPQSRSVVRHFASCQIQRHAL